MKVNMNSWHYRLIENFLDGSPSNSLCVYFWQVVLRLVVGGAMGLAMWGFFGGLASAFIVKFGWIDPATTPVWIKLLAAGLGAFLVLAVFLVVLLIIGFTIYGVVAAFKTLRTMFEQWDEKRPEKDDNLIVAFVKAKKRKVCPMIEFTLEDK